MEIAQAPPPVPVPIQELELGAYAYGSLKRQGITTVDALVKFSGADLLSLRNFGQQSLDDVRVALALRGLALRPERTSP
jgi:DNA-directed RNA polymerase subunit alpha